MAAVGAARASTRSKLKCDDAKEMLFAHTEAELDVLDRVRDFAFRKSKLDREYAANLAKLYESLLPVEVPLSSPSIEAWNALITEGMDVVELLRKRADNLVKVVAPESAHEAVEKLKKSARTQYVSGRTLVEQSKQKAEDEFQRVKLAYHEAVKDLLHTDEKRAKLTSSSPPDKVQRAHHKFAAAWTKFAKVHNEYVLAHHNVQHHRKSFYQDVLPTLLEGMLETETMLVPSMQSVFASTCQHLNFSTEPFEDAHKKLLTQVALIVDDNEFSQLEELELAPQTEDLPPLELTPPSCCDAFPAVSAGDLLVCDLTHEQLQKLSSDTEFELDDVQKRLEEKQTELERLRGSEMAPGLDKTEHCRMINGLALEIEDMQCAIAKAKAQKKLMSDALATVGEGPLPRAIADFDPAAIDLTSPPPSKLSARQILAGLGFRRKISNPSSPQASPERPVDVKPNTPAATTTTPERPMSARKPAPLPSDTAAAESQAASSMPPLAVVKSPPRKPKVISIKERKKPPPPLPGQRAAPRLPGTPSQPSAPAAETVAEATAGPTSEQTAAGSLAETPSKPTPRRQPSIPAAEPHAQPEEQNISTSELPAFCLLDKEIGLKAQPWFHGILPRVQAESIVAEPGDFIVRESSRHKGDYVVTMKDAGGAVRHFKIQSIGSDKFRFEGEAFPSVAELLLQHIQQNLPLTKQSGAKITQPVYVQQQWALDPKAVKLESVLGKGNFGEVWQGVLVDSGLQVAVKTCRDTVSDPQRFLDEAEILKQYDHPNIVKLIGVTTMAPYMIVMELCEHGALLTYLKSNTLSTDTLLRMCSEAATGMAYLASKDCIHRDLAARNCLVASDKTLKISDFGMSRMTSASEGLYQVSSGLKQLPLKWTAPEALNKGQYTTQADVWSFGVLLWEAFSGGQMPYPGMNNKLVKEKVNAGYRMEAPSDCRQEVYQLMLDCWQADPPARPTFDVLRTRLVELRSVPLEGAATGSSDT
eukprot:m.394220 g.394220  ORF g.394220 m.394220 type:complete len:985 (-) comp20096_c3_seq3:101-3055(-)